MATRTAIRSAAVTVNRTLRAADRDGDGQLTRAEVTAELTRARASKALRSAATTAFAHQRFVAGDAFSSPPAVRVSDVTRTVTANARALVELDGRKRGTAKDGVIEQKELYAATNQLSRALLVLADE